MWQEKNIFKKKQTNPAVILFLRALPFISTKYGPLEAHDGGQVSIKKKKYLF